MSDTSFTIKTVTYANIDLHISRTSKPLKNESAPVEVTFGYTMPPTKDTYEFMVTSILTLGDKADVFYCKIEQRTVVETAEEPTLTSISAWITQQKELIYQMLRQKADFLAGHEAGPLKFLPSTLGELERDDRTAPES